MNAREEKCDYEDNWSVNANEYAAQGCYDWIAAQLDSIKPKKVFDVGCGTGEGLLALRQRFGCQILSIDENSFCLRKAAARLRSDGAKVEVKERFHYLDQPGGQHVIGVENGKISLSREIMLSQGDLLLADDELFRFIESKAPFDAVTIWFIGAYMGRRSCINIADFNIRQPAEYRCHVQNKTYELAARILRPGGVLQVVDRSRMPTNDSERETILADHRAQASVTNLHVADLKFRAYDELTGGKGVRVLPTLEASVSMPPQFAWAMLSVLSYKP